MLLRRKGIDSKAKKEITTNYATNFTRCVCAEADDVFA